MSGGHTDRSVPGKRESRRHFRGRVEAALADENLQGAMTAAMTGLRAKRQRAFESLDFETGRDELRRRRRANLDRLPELLDEFKARLEDVGGVFHFARDAAEARDIVARICSEADARIVTKSKSMASEEIFLNQYLEAMGIEVVETDLGERILQLTHDHPSHLIAPAIHVTLKQWADTFGTPEDVAAVQVRAREMLRQKFIDADVGISGANFAIAETGTVGIVTNEGNADLTITLPRVHVALFGIDKLVATLDDAVAILRMLPRSGTGQRMTSYVNWVTGPSRSADILQSLTIGVHGPREMHCVVIDNGRSRMAADPVFRDALTCIRCGACSNACPPFMAVSGHQFGHVYNGPIGLVLTPFHHGDDADDLPNSLCTQCNACEEICPVGIPLPRQILEHRRRARKSIGKRALVELWSHRRLAGAALRVAAVTAPVTAAMSPLPVAARPLRDTAGRDGAAAGESIVLFASCMVDRMAPAAGRALETIARAAGYRVEFPRAQWCCGLMAANAGSFSPAASLSAELVEALDATAGPIVTPSASCFGAVSIDAPDWGAGSERQVAVAARMRDSTRFLLDLLRSRPDLLAPPAARVRVAYHDSCQTLRQLHLRSEPREVLSMAGYEVVDIPDIANCCGFGGTFSMEWPQVADRLAQWKLDAVAETGCTVMASDNPGCLVHIAAAARRRGLELRVAHVLELVADRVTGPAR